MKLKNALLAIIQWSVLLCLLASCNFSSPQSTQTASLTTKSALNTRAQHTVAMPATLTSCPATGTGRALVTAPLASGTQQNIVYVDNEENKTTSKAISGSLYRYDITTKAKTLIARIPAVAIENAQISRDGQWVLFTAMNGIQSTVTSYA
ncbi:MAG TPA: hypothetical protein VGN34_05480, partial [Ktedonobacteraceae bacterium]